MLDGPAIATLVFLAVLFFVYRVFSALARRGMRAESRSLLTAHLAHWRYPQESWRADCERQRGEIWSRYLRPSAGFALPGAVVMGGIAWVAEQRAGLPAGLAALLTLALMGVFANTILGPWVRSFLRLTRRRKFDYELFLGASGALEVWRDGGRICDTEEHPFTARGGRIERVEANGVDPAEIVFSIVQPLAFGYEHIDTRFLVPDGLIAEARALADALTPEPAPPDAG